MSANPNAATGGSTIVTIQGTSSGAPIQASSYANQASSVPTANTGSNGGGGGASDPITITRRINVKIQGSMSDFAQDGQGCATWRPVDGKQAAIWGLQDIASFGGNSATTNGDATSTHASATHALSNAIVKSAILLEHKSTFKVPLGITISCLPSNEMTGFGEAYCYTVLPESTNTVPTKLYEAGEETEEGNRWRKEYPKYNHANLEKHGVLETTTNDCAYTFVHETHPAVALLRANKDLLGSDIDQQQKIDNEWYKVQKETFATCCNTLRHKVLAKFPTRNMNDFSVEASRIGTRDWLDLQDGEDALASFKPPVGASAEEAAALETKHLEEFCEQRCAYHARLEVTFEINP